MRRSASSGSAALVAALLGLLCLAAAAPARAEDGFGAHYHRAEQLYDEARYAESIAELRVAFDIKPLPRLLLNIGQLYLKLGRPDEALAAYAAYQRLAPRRPPEAEAALLAGLAQARALRAGGATPTAPAASGPRRAGDPAAPPGAGEARGARGAPAPPEATPLRRRWWLWAGVALLAAGVTTGVALGVSRAARPPLPDDLDVLDVSFRGAALRPDGVAPALAVAW